MAVENPNAEAIETIERLEVELRSLMQKRDKTPDLAEKRLLEQEVRDLQAELKYLQSRRA